MALYMGPSSGSTFGYQGGTPPRWGGSGTKTVAAPGAAPAPMAAPPNTLAAEAIRASGPSQGYDPNYLQNMASSIGSLFSNPGTGTQNINPLGDLSEISPTSGMEGNAPSKGLPQTWLQKALGGGGFSFTPPAPPVTPTAPKVGPQPVGGGRGGRYPL
jgi:hypothetical protein